MTDARTEVVLQDLLRREGRSLLQYVCEAFPWTNDPGQEKLAVLQRLGEEERAAAAGVASHLRRLHAVAPHLGPYPMAYTTINYAALDHLLPLLAKAQAGAVADLERDLAGLADAEARLQVDRVLQTKRHHLTTLQSLATK